MNDHTITSEAHEKVDQLLYKASSIARALAHCVGCGDEKAISGAFWAVDEMIREAHDLIGRA
jgi:hypothetical protein